MKGNTGRLLEKENERMKKVRVLCLALFVLCSFGTARAAEPVRIGVIAPLTGSQANLGTGVVNGIKSPPSASMTREASMAHRSSWSSITTGIRLIRRLRRPPADLRRQGKLILLYRELRHCSRPAVDHEGARLPGHPCFHGPQAHPGRRQVFLQGHRHRRHEAKGLYRLCRPCPET